MNNFIQLNAKTRPSKSQLSQIDWATIEYSATVETARSHGLFQKSFGNALTILFRSRYLGRKIWSCSPQDCRKRSRSRWITRHSPTLANSKREALYVGIEKQNCFTFFCARAKTRNLYDKSITLHSKRKGFHSANTSERSLAKGVIDSGANKKKGGKKAAQEIVPCSLWKGGCPRQGGPLLGIKVRLVRLTFGRGISAMCEESLTRPGVKWITQWFFSFPLFSITMMSFRNSAMSKVDFTKKWTRAIFF